MLCLARPDSERGDKYLDAMAGEYSEILFQSIPEDRLGDVYILAMKNHRSNFPLTTSDFLSAWEKIQGMEAGSKPKIDPCLYCRAIQEDPDLGKCPFHDR